MHQIAIFSFDTIFAPIIKSIRSVVFIEEQEVPKALEIDGNDADAIDALIAIDGLYAGAGRMLPDRHIGLVAVMMPFRRKGIGKQLISALIEQAAIVGMNRVFLGAQLAAKTFYEKLGFSPHGDLFLDAGIQHIHMERSISNGV